MKSITSSFLPEIERSDLIILLSMNEEILKKFCNSPFREKIIVITDEKKGNLPDLCRDLRHVNLKTTLEDAFYLTLFLDKILFRVFVESGLPEDKNITILSDSPFRLSLQMKSEDIPLIKTVKHLAEKIDSGALEALLRIIFEIHKEGREGRSIGTLFVVGDVQEALSYTQQLIINPYQGQPENLRKIQNPENWESVKELAQLDGAFVLDRSGRIYCAGAYILVKNGVSAHPGFGGRHLAAASISQGTDSIAFALSSSGSLSIFENGKVIFKQDLR